MTMRLPLLVSLLAFSGSLALAEQKSFLTRPDIHGDLVVFTAEGDLWLGDIASGTAKRITSDPGTETAARFSPDGKWIAFTANYDGGTDVYAMPTAGGSPRRLTYDSKGAGVLGWTPDGKRVIFRSRRQQGIEAYRRLWSVPIEGGLPGLLPVPRGEFASMGPDGLLAYVPVSNEWMNWFRYKAGAADDIWLCDTGKPSYTKLTSFGGVDTTPVWAGGQIYYVSEAGGSLNLFRIDPRTKKIAQITRNVDNPIRYPGSDGRRVVFQAGVGLGMFDIGTGEVKTLQFQMDSDRIHMRDQRVPVSRSVQSANIGPTGKRVLVEARGQILSVAVDEGDMRVLENEPGARAMMPVWSPDGKRVAFVGDRTGENEIWTTDAAAGGTPKRLTNGLKANPLQPVWSPDGKQIALVDRNGRFLLIDATTGAITELDQAEFTGSYDAVVPQIAFSPDSKLIAYARPELNWLSTVWVVDIATKKRAELGTPGVNAYAPAFSPDGRYVAYLEDRALTPQFPNFTRKYSFDNTTKVTIAAVVPDAPSPFLAKNDEEAPATPPAKEEQSAAAKTAPDLDGLSNRLIEPPIAAGRYSAIQWVEGRILLLNATAAGVENAPPSEVLSFDIAKKSTIRLASDVKDWALSADRKRLLLKNDSSLSVIDAAASAPPDPKRVDLSPYSVVVQPEREWEQIFQESWRIARDVYYDPNMHGVNWEEVRRRYQALMPLVGDRTDLSRLLADMVSELRTGHAYITNPAPYAAKPSEMGFLGADFEPSSEGVRIAKLYRGDPFSVGLRSPLLDPGLNVKEGDFILAIAGRPVEKDQDVQALLVGLQNQTVAISVNDKPSMEGARIVRVRLLSSEDALRYQDWVMGRQDYVRKVAGPNYGYVHVPDMGGGGVAGFVKGQLPNAYKEGVVYDFRYNGGGFASSMILDNIRTKPVIWWQSRSGGNWTRESWASLGYAAALCNEYNFSDGELVIETWKRMGLGPVVGKTTGGGEVGSGGGYQLIDGGGIYVPNYGAFVDGHWVVEGTGAQPDYEVEQDPAAVMAGRDPQLDKALDLLKAQVAKRPIVLPVHPPFRTQ